MASQSRRGTDIEAFDKLISESCVEAPERFNNHHAERPLHSTDKSIVKYRDILPRFKSDNNQKYTAPMVVEFKSVSFNSYASKVMATDYSTEQPMVLTLWELDQSIVEEGRMFYFSGVEFQYIHDNRLNKRYLSGVVRTRTCRVIRPATDSEIAELKRDNPSSSLTSVAARPPETLVSPAAAYSSPRMAVEVPHNKHHQSNKAAAAAVSQQRYNTIDYIPESATTVNSSIQQLAAAMRKSPPNSPNTINTPNQSSNKSENLNVVLESKLDLKKVTILELLVAFELTKASNADFHVRGEVRGYWPKNFSDWSKSRKSGAVGETGQVLFFVLYLNDGTSQKDLPVIFEGDHARTFLGITDSMNGAYLEEHIRSQMRYVIDQPIELYVEAGLQVEFGVRVSSYIGFGVAIRPLLKRKFLQD